MCKFGGGIGTVATGAACLLQQKSNTLQRAAEAFWTCSAFGVALYNLETLELTANAAFYQMGCL